MTTLSPTQYEKLPEQEKAYWKAGMALKGNPLVYIPVTIDLCDAEKIVKGLIEGYREDRKTCKRHGDREEMAECDKAIEVLTEALNQLKEKANENIF